MWHWLHRLQWGRRTAAYAAGELPPVQAGRVAARVAACAGCRRDVEAYRRVSAALRAAGRAGLTRGEALAFWPEVRRRIGEGRTGAARPVRPGFREILWDHPRLSLASAVTAGILVLAVTLGPLVGWGLRAWQPGNGVEVTSVEAGDDTPVMLFQAPNSPLKVIWIFEQNSPS